MLDAATLDQKLERALASLAQLEHSGRVPPEELGVKRLQLFRTLFERIIDRVPGFGSLLSRVKFEYEAVIQAATSGLRLSEVAESAAQWERQAREQRAVNDRLEEENATLRDEIDALLQRSLQLEDRLRESKTEPAHSNELAEQEAIAAELAREMPASARPGNITPSLGSGRLASVPRATMVRPADVPCLDMSAVDRVRADEFSPDGGVSSYAAAGAADSDEDDVSDFSSASDEEEGETRPVDELAVGVPTLDLASVVRVSYGDEFAKEGGEGVCVGGGAGFSHATAGLPRVLS